MAGLLMAGLFMACSGDSAPGAAFAGAPPETGADAAGSPGDAEPPVDAHADTGPAPETSLPEDVELTDTPFEAPDAEDAAADGLVAGDVPEDAGAPGDVGGDVPPPPPCAAEPSLCQDGNPCTDDLCVPAGCTHKSNYGACDDGNACTGPDTCGAGGACKPGAGPPDCDDANVCTDDSCDPAIGCVHLPNQAPCSEAACDAGIHFAAAQCSASVCPAPVVTDCDDANVCTDDSCDLAVGCAHVANQAPCLEAACEANVHHAAAQCSASACPAPVVTDCDDANVCTDDSCASAVGCVHVANQAPCLDAACDGTVHFAASQCSASACPAPVATACADDLACTADACDPLAGCSHGLTAGSCLIDGVCRADGEPSLAEPCRVCRASVEPLQWSVADDGAACGAGRACLDGDCQGPLITELMAKNNKTLADEDGDFSDWFELYNPTTAALSLEGYHVSDKADVTSKWTFPAVSIPPGGYLVVFASGKDRADPAGTLHTSFKLDADGESLVLTSPGLDWKQELGPFPPQVSDISYGIDVAIDKTLLVGPTDVVRYRVPAGADPPADWADVGFDDAGAGWSSGLNGLGFDLSPPGDPLATEADLGVPTADSVADWSMKGIQGEHGWTYGYYNRTADPDKVYSASNFVPFPHDGKGFSASDYWTGSIYDWYSGNPPWTTIGPKSVHPNGANNGAEHWAIRRYEVQTPGTYLVRWHIAKTDPGGGGVTGTVFRQGALVDTAAIAGADLAGVTRTVVLPTVAAGELVDLALGPTGPGGQTEDWYDSSVSTASLWLMADLSDDIATDVGASMMGASPGLYVRATFDLEDPEAFNRLWLRMKFDDGFAATIDGALVASANAPDALGWSAVATAKQSKAAAMAFATYDLREQLGLLEAGAHVLAIHALNVAVSDPTLLVLAELEGRHVAYDASTTRYYGTPTPGADNDPSSGGKGPVVVHLTPPGKVSLTEDKVVSAWVQPAGEAVANVTLTWRVMFGPEVTAPMTQGADGVFTAAIPAGTAAPGQMIRWYVRAVDAAGSASRAPVFLDPLDSEEYYGTVVADPTVVTSLPLIECFLENPSAAATWAGTRGALFYGAELYDNVRFDLHGQSTAGFPKKSYDIDFNSDHRFLLSKDYKRMKDINLLSNWADKSKVRNTLAYETLRDAGTGYHLAFPVRVQRNGAFFSVADFVEDGDDRWLERIGLDPDGALYKEYDGLVSTSLAEKKTRKDEDASDLQALIDGLGQTGGALRSYLYDHVNIPAMVNFYAGLAIISDRDCCHKNYYAYRDTLGSGEWRYLPWDVDLTFGHNWIKSVGYFDDTLHADNAFFAGGGNKLTTALKAQPEFLDMFYRRVRSLTDQLQQPPGTPTAALRFETRIDELDALIGADGLLDYQTWGVWGLNQTMEQAASYMKTTYLEPRRVFLYQTQTAAGGGPLPEAQGSVLMVFGPYDPSSADPAAAYFTLQNPNAVSVDLSGWSIEGDIAFTFAPGTVLPAGGQLYVSPNLVAFRARKAPPTGGQGLLVVGSYLGVLSGVDSLVLLDESGAPVP